MGGAPVLLMMMTPTPHSSALIITRACGSCQQLTEQRTTHSNSYYPAYLLSALMVHRRTGGLLVGLLSAALVLGLVAAGVLLWLRLAPPPQPADYLSVSQTAWVSL